MGDMGGANVVRLLYPELIKMGLSVQIIADGGDKAKAHLVLEKAGLSFERQTANSASKIFGEGICQVTPKFLDAIRAAGIIFVTPCVTAFRAGLAAANYGKEYGRIVVLGPGLDFDHAYPYWRDALVDYVIANSSFQQSSILALRKYLAPEQVLILGNPIFDSIPGLVIRHSEIRTKVRQTLGLEENEKMLLYWSPADREDLCEASFKALIIGLNGLARCHSNLVLCLRLHPKLDVSIRPGYYREKETLIKGTCTALGIRLIADAGEIAAEELNFAADLVIAERATQAIMAAMCGIPTAFILLTPHRKFFEEVLSQKFPYLDVLEEGVATGIYKED
ncbi:MAG: hypothetical protein Q8N68_02770, partial [bacterium]|nr:hypothetical protein [bacterium]